MKIIFDSQLLDAADFHVGILDRCFRYGDGLFETIIVKEGNIQLLNYHYERLVLGTTTLGISIRGISLKYLSDAIQRVAEANELEENARIRLQVWRAGEGLFGPETNQSHYLLSASALTINQKPVRKVRIAESLRLQHSIFSPFKTCNALPYVIAAQEKIDNKLDEIILLDIEGNLAECSASNLFWKIEKKLYTPDLQTGCVAGIMRRHIIKTARDMGTEVQEVKSSPDILEEADMIFSSNVSGINYFEIYQGKKLNVDGVGITLP